MYVFNARPYRHGSLNSQVRYNFKPKSGNFIMFVNSMSVEFKERLLMRFCSPGGAGDVEKRSMDSVKVSLKETPSGATPASTSVLLPERF